MLNNKVSYRYAQALFSLAKERGLQDVVLTDCKLFLRSFSETGELFILIKNPTIHKELKKQLFEKVFSNKIEKTTMDFIRFLLQRGRESHLSDILEKYILLYNKERNIVIAEVISSRPLEANQISIIKDKLISLGKVDIKQRLDPRLIGGFVIKIGDLKYDTSIKKQIKNVKRALKL